MSSLEYIVMISNKQHTGFGASMEPCNTSTGLIRPSMVSFPFALIRTIHMATTVCLPGALTRACVYLMHLSEQIW